MGLSQPEAKQNAGFLEFPQAPITPLKAMEERHSVRQYTDRPIEDGIARSLAEAIGIINEIGNLDIKLVLDEPRAFSGFKSKLVNFSGVRNYFVLVGPECKELDSVLGYYGEKLVLYAQALGLNTCWVGSTYRMVNHAYSVDLGEKLSAVIAFGYGETQGKPHKSKKPQDVSPSYDSAPDWFKCGVDAALLAPTALNQQKFSFRLEEKGGIPIVRASTKRGAFAQMDLGIAKCHFEIGVEGAEFEWK